MGNLTIRNNRFELDGQPVRLLSAAMHYFRTPRAYWRDRLLKLKAAGFNAIETYVAWNLHQPSPERKYCFEDMLDLEAFIRLVGEIGMHAIVRPGPYICTEWDFGGLPWWLLADDNIRLRCMNKPYLAAVDQWFDELIPRLCSLQSTHGGPIIAMQVENEYGSYGNDAQYLDYLRQGMVARGIDVPLFTSDGPTDFMLQGGTLPDVFKTANFGSRSAEAFAKLAEYEKKGPMMCMEFWIGWFDHWGEPHITRTAEDVAQETEAILASGASVNFYMGHGGTNFGYMAGANYGGHYQEDVSSYDYNCLLTEDGRPTDKYWAVREVLSRYTQLPDMELPAPAERIAPGRIALDECAALLDNLAALDPTPVHEACPEPMEKVGQGYGYILYRTHISGPRGEFPLILDEVHDRAEVFLDGAWVGRVMRDGPKDAIRISIPERGARLDVLVMGGGRVNYGPYLADHKGITKRISLGQQNLYHYDIYRLPMTDRSRLNWTAQAKGPAFYRGRFTLEKTGDTFLKVDGGHRGEVWINGFHLGRFDERGPQQTLYVPAPLLNAGENVVEVFDLQGGLEGGVQLLDGPILDRLKEEGATHERSAN